MTPSPTSPPKYPFPLPKLRFDYNALEPFIDEQTMRLHHQKHHQGYLDNLNAALAPHPDLHDLSIEEILLRYPQLPDDLKPSIRTQGGGHANHQFFWKILKAAPGNSPTEPIGPLAEAIQAAFGSFPTFQAAFTDAALRVFGSGWTFLVIDPANAGKLKIHSTANQDSVLLEGLPGLLCCDLWEHAYYLKYQNRRADYLLLFGMSLIGRSSATGWKPCEPAGNSSKKFNPAQTGLLAFGSVIPLACRPVMQSREIGLQNEP